MITLNSIADFWNDYHTWNTSPATDVCDILDQEIPKHIDHCSTLLEVGCGNGVVMKHLMRKYTNLAGCDISVNAVANSKRLLGSEASIRHIDSANFFFQEKRHDMILLVKTLGSVGNDAELQNMSNNLVHILKDNGTLLIIDFAVDDNSNYCNKYSVLPNSGIIKFTPYWSKIPFYHFSTKSILSLFPSLQLSHHKNIKLLSCNNNTHLGIMCVLKKGVTNGN